MKPIFAILAAVGFAASAANYTQYVDPFIGTGAVDGGLTGNTYPGATVPFGMVQLSPDTHFDPYWYKASGYHYTDSVIYGFSHTRLSGTGACDLIDVTFFPTVSNLRKSAFTHHNEEARPGYYAVMLDDELIRVELTTTLRAGMQRYTFPEAENCKVVVDMDHSATKGDWGRQILNSQIRQVSPTAISGYRIITGWAKIRKVCFYTEFSDTIRSIKFFDGNRAVSDGDVINGRQLSAVLDFGSVERVTCRTGISPVSVENARLNLHTEMPTWNFEEYVSRADAQWNEALSQIEVQLDSERMTTFYTALYHTMIQPNLFSDVNGQYMTADYSLGQKPEGKAEYTTFSLWDTYRAAHPLYTILSPTLTADFVNSMLDHYDAYGYLPIWQLWGQDNYCMIGNHAIPVVVDAVLKGVPGIDPQRAWEAVKTTSTTSHPNSPWDVWEKYGYMPEPIQTQSVSITLEIAFDDWCVAQLAQHLGYEEDYQRFIARSEYYNNLYNHDTHFFQSKDEHGQWIEPFDPLRHGANGGNPFTEGNAWQYYWYVPHNIARLVELTGGNKAFEKKLDDFFATEAELEYKNDNVSGCIGQYAHGNEPSHHVAYLYNYVGRPDKTQSLVNRIMHEMYNNSSSGYAGNDDCGEMSSWYIFSALGFYPVNPASGEYAIGTPAVDSAVINLENGKKFEISVKRRTPTDIYIKKITLNGKPLKSLTLSHSDIMAGGMLEVELSSKPKK